MGAVAARLRPHADAAGRHADLKAVTGLAPVAGACSACLTAPSSSSACSHSPWATHVDAVVKYCGSVAVHALVAGAFNSYSTAPSSSVCSHSPRAHGYAISNEAE